MFSILAWEMLSDKPVTMHKGSRVRTLYAMPVGKDLDRETERESCQCCDM